MSSYTRYLDAGLLLGLGVFYWRARTRVVRPHRWLDAALVALAAGVLAGRLGYAVAHWTYFEQYPAEILRFWLGGLSWHSALFGVLASLALYCSLRRLSLWRLADELALVGPLVAGAASAGCIQVGCAYGREASGAHWLVAEMPDVFGVRLPRYNVPLLTAGWSAMVLILLWSLRKRLPTGGLAGVFFLAIGLGFACFDALRGDAVAYWGAVRLDAVLDWAVGVFGAIWLGAALLVSRKRRPGWREIVERDVS